MKKQKTNYPQVRPINDRVVVLPEEAEKTTSGGIIIPDTAKEKPQRGTVVAVGEGKPHQKMTVQLGDVVMFAQYAGQEMEWEGINYAVMREDDILVILG